MARNMTATERFWQGLELRRSVLHAKVSMGIASQVEVEQLDYVEMQLEASRTIGSSGNPARGENGTAGF